MAAPYIPLYIADYHVDTTHLNRSEHGAYLLLLMAMWRAGGKLPRSDDKLARLAKCTPDEWDEIKDTILEFFVICGGLIKHKRITKEFSKYETKILSAQKGGITTRSKNLNKNKEKNENSLRGSLGSKQGSEKALTQNLELNNNKPPIVPLNGDAPFTDFPDTVLSDYFNDFWSVYPRKISKSQAQKKWATMSQKDRDAAMSAIKAQSAVWAKDKTEERFIPHPATWLNQKRFEDFSQTPAKPKEMTEDERKNHEALCKLWRDRLSEYKETKRWLLYWGRFPDHWECTIPKEVLIEYGYEPRKISA